MKIINKPGFEFVFTLSLMGILVLPLLVFSQGKKTISIKIINTDTTVNGINIKKLPEAERKEALAAIQDLPPAPPLPPGIENSSATIVLKADKNVNKDVIIEKSIVTDNSNTLSSINPKDSTQVRVRLKKLNGGEGAFTYRFDNDLPPIETRINKLMPNGPEHKPFMVKNRNSQTFNYSNTDNDGISTSVSYSVNDAAAEKLKSLTGADKATLELSNLNLGYEFSTGKTILTLTLPASGAAEFKFISSNGKQLWEDKASSAGFTKKFDLMLNGVYYLQVKQTNKVALKKIVKE